MVLLAPLVPKNTPTVIVIRHEEQVARISFGGRVVAAHTVGWCNNDGVFVTDVIQTAIVLDSVISAW